jgi:glycosyltransferase involved in cell wall biosynthesis
MTAEPSKVTVIVPCFNHGAFLADTVRSVTELSRDDLELIVVDDGSTDDKTCKELDALSALGINVIRQPNGGVGAARNAGIRASNGKFIFPLDADDLLRDGWIDSAIRTMEASPRVGIVYGDAQFFGTWKHRWHVGPVELEWMLEKNFIPVSALFRRAVWEQNGGFDTTMPVQGYEDWDFWLGAIERGWEFSYLPEIFFDYRKAVESMLTRAGGFESQIEDFVARKHGPLYRQAWLNQVTKAKSVRWTSRQLGSLLSLRAKARWEIIAGRKS